MPQSHLTAKPNDGSSRTFIPFKGDPMGAKNKLNASYCNGVLIIAGGIALLTKSWTVFAVAVVALLVTSIIAGDVRF